MMNLYKILISPNFKYGNTALIAANNKYIYKWEQIQMHVLRSVLRLNRNMNNEIVRKCANILPSQREQNNLLNHGLKKQ